MYANATVVEIDNRITRLRRKVLVPAAPGRLIHALLTHFTELDPQGDELISVDRDPLGCAPLDVCVFIDDALGHILIVVYCTGATIAIDPVCGFNNRAWEADFVDDEARDEAPSETVANLAANLCRLMIRDSIDLDELANGIDLCPVDLKGILQKETEATLTELCSLAKFFGVTVSDLLTPPKDRKAGEWN